MSNAVTEEDLKPAMPTSKIVDSIWFDKIGIVKIWNGFENKRYIGVGAWVDINIDEKLIANYWMPFYMPPGNFFNNY